MQKAEPPQENPPCKEGQKHRTAGIRGCPQSPRETQKRPERGLYPRRGKNQRETTKKRGAKGSPGVGRTKTSVPLRKKQKKAAQAGAGWRRKNL